VFCLWKATFMFVPFKSFVIFVSSVSTVCKSRPPRPGMGIA
jgi:hypothetical protein